MIDKLITIWESMEAREDSNGLQLQRLDSMNGMYDIYIGVDRPSMRRTFLVRLNDSASRSDIDSLSTDGLAIDLVTISKLDNDSSFLAIYLDEAAYEHIFAYFISSILDALSEAEDGYPTFVLIKSVLSTWKQFLKTARGSLSIESQRGLFGELCFLKSLVERHGSPAVYNWSGAKATSKDFEFHRKAIEVKSTFSNAPLALKISNLLQLDDADLDELYLLHQSFEIAETGALTLQDIIDDIRKLLGISGELQKFNDMLIAYGYIEEDRHEYTEEYRHILSRIYHVKSDFPRLTKQMASSAIVSATYEISLGACVPYVTDLDDVIESLTEDIHAN